MDKFFSAFGKIALLLIVVAGLIGGGVYLDRYVIHKPNSQSTQVTPTVAEEMVSPTIDIITPTLTKGSTHFAVSAGGVNPFKSYTLSAVSGWGVSKTHNTTMDQIILTQGEYQLSIYQAAIGGGGCTFPGDQPQQMSISLTEPHEIPLLDGSLLKRGKTVSPTATKSSYTICQKGSDGSFGSLTVFGAITYTTPLSPDALVLAQMDAMVGSLQKQ